MKAVAEVEALNGEMKSDTFFEKMSKNVLPYVIIL